MYKIKLAIESEKGYEISAKIKKIEDTDTPNKKDAVKLKFQTPDTKLDSFCISDATIYIEELKMSNVGNALKALAFRLVNEYNENSDDRIDGKMSVNDMYRRLGLHRVISEISTLSCELFFAKSMSEVVDDTQNFEEEIIKDIDDLIYAYTNGEVLIDTSSIVDELDCSWTTRVDFSEFEDAPVDFSEFNNEEKQDTEE